MYQLCVSDCPRAITEKLEALLEDAGALSVTMTDQYDDAILEPELGTAPLWPHVVLQALFSTLAEGEYAMSLLLQYAPNTNCNLQKLIEKDWERVSLEQFKPLLFGKRLWICPSWITPPEPTAVTLILDPGLAFGTGTHPTTAHCLTWLEQADLLNKTVIDYGCGSGILALAAIQLGAAHVTAVDIDQQALIATRNNAKANHITDTQLTIGFPEILQTPVDLIIANILLAPLLTLQNQFLLRLKPGGILIVSGILEEQVPQLQQAYEPHFTQQETVLIEGWALCVFQLGSAATKG